MKTRIKLKSQTNTNNISGRCHDSIRDLKHWGWKNRRALRMPSISNIIASIMTLGIRTSGYGEEPEKDHWFHDTDQIINRLPIEDRVMLIYEFSKCGRQKTKITELHMTRGEYNSHLDQAINRYTRQKNNYSMFPVEPLPVRLTYL